MNEAVMDEIKIEFKKCFQKYSFLWRHERETHGDIDIDAFLLEVFGVPAQMKLEFVRKARSLRRESETRIGRKIILISHTPEATREHYAHLFEIEPGPEGIFLHSEISLRTIEPVVNWPEAAIFASIGQAVPGFDEYFHPGVNGNYTGFDSGWVCLGDDFIPIAIRKIEGYDENYDEYAKAA